MIFTTKIIVDNHEHFHVMSSINYSRQICTGISIYGRGYTRQIYLGKCEVFLGKVAFSCVTDFTSGKVTKVNVHGVRSG